MLSALPTCKRIVPVLLSVVLAGCVGRTPREEPPATGDAAPRAGIEGHCVTALVTRQQPIGPVIAQNVSQVGGAIERSRWVPSLWLVGERRTI